MAMGTQAAMGMMLLQTKEPWGCWNLGVERTELPLEVLEKIWRYQLGCPASRTETMSFCCFCLVVFILFCLLSPEACGSSRAKD